MSPDLLLPVRETFWNIPAWAVIGVYVAGLLSIGVALWGLWQRVRLWHGGGPEPTPRFDQLPRRATLLLREGLLQARVLSQRLPGLMHAGIFFGFIVLLIGTILATIDWEITRLLFDWRLLQGRFYLAYEAVLDAFGLAFLIGLGLAVWRRFVQRSPRVEASTRFAQVLALLFAIVATGFVIEAARLAVTQPSWAPWSFAGWALARGLLGLGLDESSLRALHLATWLLHAVLVFGFIVLLPRSHFTHLVATPLNIVLAKLGPTGVAAKIEAIEEQQSLGVSRFEQFSWKRRLDFDACTECGRCQAACCAQLSGSVLNPKAIIGKLKRYMHAGGGASIDGQPLHGGLISAEELWACTTCGACISACPARIDIIDTIVDLRRHLALEQGAFPQAAAHTLHNIQRLGNPWGMDPADRLEWAWGLDVPKMEPGTPVDVLYWVGCSASFDQRNHHIARSMVKILRAAGIRFGVMAEERCHAEVGRRLGEEYLFQTAAAENIDNLSRYTFKRILAHCPHCFNTLQHEYPQFDRGRYEVVHHTVLIAELLAGGRLRPLLPADTTIALHDPCYLGRHNGEYDAPRAVLDQVAGSRRVELAASRAQATCCGGGGGQMWMETHARKRINIIRAEELLASGARTAAVACPHCLTMLDAGLATLDAREKLRVRDLAEIVADALPDDARAAGPAPPSEAEKESGVAERGVQATPI
jgi:Fe-S oxidoreductase/nitrate reductase gamma subunit